jgi:hypothetical protein
MEIKQKLKEIEKFVEIFENYCSLYLSQGHTSIIEDIYVSNRNLTNSKEKSSQKLYTREDIAIKLVELTKYNKEMFK